MNNDIDYIIISEDDIKQICREMGARITKDYEGQKPILVGLLKGCIPFMADLIKHIDLYLEIDFMSVSSYHGDIKTSGDVKIKKDLDVSIQGRDVIIVEDIVDTGNTITTIVELFKHRGAKSIRVATLLDKPDARVKDFEPYYIGLKIPKVFVVGYGLDYEELYRNLPYVGVLKPEIYK